MPHTVCIHSGVCHAPPPHCAPPGKAFPAPAVHENSLVIGARGQTERIIRIPCHVGHFIAVAVHVPNVAPMPISERATLPQLHVFAEAPTRNHVAGGFYVCLDIE